MRQDRLDNKTMDLLKSDFSLNDDELEAMIINIKYELYFKREMARLNNNGKEDDIRIPAYIDYKSVKNISNEAINALSKHKPGNISQAKRLEGVKPPDIISLLAYIKDVSRETSGSRVRG